jgi:hypothetical protein
MLATNETDGKFHEMAEPIGLGSSNRKMLETIPRTAAMDSSTVRTSGCDAAHAAIESILAIESCGVTLWRSFAVHGPFARKPRTGRLSHSRPIHERPRAAKLDSSIAFTAMSPNTRAYAASRSINSRHALAENRMSRLADAGET